MLKQDEHCAHELLHSKWEKLFFVVKVVIDVIFSTAAGDAKFLGVSK